MRWEKNFPDNRQESLCSPGGTASLRTKRAWHTPDGTGATFSLSSGERRFSPQTNIQKGSHRQGINDACPKINMGCSARLIQTLAKEDAYTCPASCIISAPVNTLSLHQNTTSTLNSLPALYNTGATPTSSLLSLNPNSNSSKSSHHETKTMAEFTAEDEALIMRFVGLQTGEASPATVQIPIHAATSTNWHLCVLVKVVSDRVSQDANFIRTM